MFFFLIGFLIVFDPFFGYSKGLGVFFGVIFLLVYLFKSGFVLRYSDNISLIYLLVFNFSLFLVIFFADGQISFLFTLIKVSLIAFIVPLVFNNFKNHDENLFFKGFCYAWIFQAIFLVSSMFSQEVREFGGFFRPPADLPMYKTIEDEGTPIRLWVASGQVISGLAAISVPSFFVVFCRNLHKKSFIYILSLFCIAFVGLSSGRTFFLSVFFCLILLMKINFLGFLKFSLMLIVSAFLFYLILNEFDSNIAFWAFEPILNMIDGAGFSSRSTADLLDSHYFIPSFNDVLFPSFIFTNENGFAAGTDSGYIRYLLFGGPFFIIGFFLIFFISLRNNNGFYSIFYTSLIFMFITFKQESLTNSSLLYVLIVCSYFVNFRNDDFRLRDKVILP